MDLLHRYHAYTLIDITKTDVYTNEPIKERNQQRNWETVQQVLSLRAQLLSFDYLGVMEDDVKNYSFGIDYRGQHRIWQFEFTVEHEDVYSLGHDRYGALKDDFKITPIILGLDETARPSVPLFYASGSEKNIYFITVQD